MDNSYSVNKEAPKEARKYNISPALEGAALGLFALLLTFITAYFIYSNSMEVLKHEIKDGLLRTVSAIVPSLDTEKIEKFKSYTADDQFKDDYQQMISLLQKIRIGTKHISFLYINTIVDGKVYYILDPVPVDEEGKPIYDDEKSNEPSIPMSLYNDPDDILIKCFEENKAFVTDEPYTDEWGTFFSAYAPIVNHDGKVIGTLGADLRINELMDRCHPMVDATKRAFIVSVSLAMLLGTFVWFTRRFTFMLNESRQTIYQNFLVAKRFADQTSTSIGSQFQKTSSILRYISQKLETISKLENKESIIETLKQEQQNLNRFADRLLTLGELKYSKRKKELENFSIAEVNDNILKEFKEDNRLADKVKKVTYDIDKDIPQILYGPVISYEELLGHIYELCLSQFNSNVYSKTILIEERNKDVILRQTFAVSTEGLSDEKKKLAEAITRNISSENWGEQVELSESINIPIIQELLYILGSAIKSEIKDDFFKINFEFVLLKSQEEDDEIEA